MCPTLGQGLLTAGGGVGRDDARAGLPHASAFDQPIVPAAALEQNMTILGIDPGLDGAIAVIRDGYLSVYDMPVLKVKKGARKNNREIDRYELARIIDAAVDGISAHAFVEQCQSQPGWGHMAAFKFGRTYECPIAILAANLIPFTLVSPRRWKNKLQVSADKDAARERASQWLPHCAKLWPLKKHDGRAEAAMIALYGARELAWSIEHPILPASDEERVA